MKKQTAKKIAGCIFRPISFFVVVYMIVYILTAPIIRMGASIFGMVFLKEPPVFDIPEQTPITYMYKGGEVKASEIDYPKYSEVFGILEIYSLGVKRNIVYGDERRFLEKSVGMYAGSHFPGEGSTTLIAGHNNRKIFNHLGEIQIGDIVRITTTYGIYEYRVRETKVFHLNEIQKAYDLNADHENLILYTCYPFKTLGYFSKRFFVYCDFITGPTVLKGE